MLYDVYLCFAYGKRLPTPKIVAAGPVRGKLTFDCHAVGSSQVCYAVLSGPDGRDLLDPLSPARREYLEDGYLLITGKQLFADTGLKRNRDRRLEQQWLCQPVQ